MKKMFELDIRKLRSKMTQDFGVIPVENDSFQVDVYTGSNHSLPIPD